VKKIQNILGNAASLEYFAWHYNIPGYKIFCDAGNKHSLIISSATLLVAACAIKVLLAKRYGRCGIFDSKTTSEVISRDLCVWFKKNFFGFRSPWLHHP